MNAVQDLETLLHCLDSYAGMPPGESRPAIWQKRISEGVQAIQEEDVPVEQVVELLQFLGQQQENVSLANPLAETLVSRYLSGEKPDWRASGISSDRGALYLLLAYQQVLANLAKQVTAEVSLTQWNEKTCPICGGTPFIAYLSKEDGRRMLVCEACLTEWRYQRIGCACCGETNPEKLESLTTEAFPGWMIYTCRTCNGFLKTVDLRQIAAKPEWRQASVATLTLDYAAQKWLSSSQPA